MAFRAAGGCTSLAVAAVLTFSAQGTWALDWASYQHDVQHTGLTGAALSPLNLGALWTSPQGYTGGLLVGDGLVAMKPLSGANAAHLTRFDAATGAVQWDFTGSYFAPSPVTYAEGLLIYTAKLASDYNQQFLYVHDATTGALKYSVPISASAIALTPTVTRNPATNKLMAYVQIGTSLTAVELGATSGSTLWSTGGSIGTSSLPSVVGNSVLLAGPGQYYAFDQSTGTANRFWDGGVSGGGGDTVVVDSSRNQFYVTGQYTATTTALTAYRYTSNNQITQLWQKTGTGVRLNNDAAIGPDGKVYSLDASTLVELDPATGAVLRSLSGQNFCGSNAPLISDGYLWTFSATQTFVYDLDTFTLAATLNDSPGNNLRTLRSLGALSDNYLVLERGEGSSYPRLVVYGTVPEPASLALLGLGALGLVVRRRRR